MTNRREFLITGAAALAIPPIFGSGRLLPHGQAEGIVMTVLGPIPPDRIGVTLPHEHLMSTVGSDITPEPDHTYGPAAYEAVLPHLQELRRLGVETLMDAGPPYLGRAPETMRALSRASGIQIVVPTGYYGAANDRYVPEHALAEPAERLADRWAAEWRNGIGRTGIRPGFIKIGVDRGPLSETDAKLVRAAAMAHRVTGLTIASHTGGTVEAARQQLELLRQEGVDPSAWIWVHAQGAEDTSALAEAAAEGAWISLDGLQPENAAGYADRIFDFRERGLLHRVLVSHDAVVYRTDGRRPRLFGALFSDLLPLLRRRGLAESEIHRLTVLNPRDAFTVGIRERSALPMVFVVGDSISIQYGPYLERYLVGAARYARKLDDAGGAHLGIPEGPQGGDSRMALAYLTHRAAEPGFSPDLLVVNAGLHDIKRDPRTGAAQVTLEEHRANLEALVRLARGLGARLVWVSTTPVDDERHNTRSRSFHRFDADRARYDRAAREVMARHGIPVVDLHAFTSSLEGDRYVDHVHFDEATRALQGAFVAGALRQILQVPAPVPPPGG